MTHQMLWIGLTGRIGSGKSTAATFFKSQGAALIDADEINHALMLPTGQAYAPLVQHFGPGILNPDQTINRSVLRQHMMHDPAAKMFLEELLHPMIRDMIRSKMKELYSQQLSFRQSASAKTISSAIYGMIEIPLLMHRQDYPYLNRVLYIDAPESLQRKRIVQRNHFSTKEADRLIALQAPRAQYIQIADDVIINDGSLLAFKKQLKLKHLQYSDQRFMINP